MSTLFDTALLRALSLCSILVSVTVTCSDNGGGGDRSTATGSGSGNSSTVVGTTSGSSGTGSVTGTSGAGGSNVVATGTGPTGTTVSTGTAGGTSTGAGGSGGAGGSTGFGGGGVSQDAGTIIGTDGGGNFGDTVCGAGVTPVGLGRCATPRVPPNPAGYVKANGSALTIANFEDTVLTAPTNHNTIFFGDGRAGNFIDLHGKTLGAVTSMTVEQTAGIPGATAATTWAIHYKGTATGGASPMFSLPVADCYDMRLYKGVSFWIKGNPAAGNDHLKFMVHTPVAQPVQPLGSGGCSAADEAAGKCDDHFRVYVPITTQWTRYNVHWSDLKQNCPSNIPANYDPAQYNEMFSFAIPKSNAGFDVWMDNFTFDPGDLPTNSLTDIIAAATFNEMWSLDTGNGLPIDQRRPFYTYAGMTAALAGFPQISAEPGSNAVARRIEAAALFSNIAHETDSLAIVEETACAGGKVQAALCQGYGVSPPPTSLTYHGRGPIQLTLGVNYASAKNALGLTGAQDIVANPQIVATDPNISWRTAFWFWTGGLSGGGTTPQGAINGGQGLGGTIRVINGIECGGANTAAVQDRIRHFKRFSYLFGLDPGALANGC
jgi:hypothetical protein